MACLDFTRTTVIFIIALTSFKQDKPKVLILGDSISIGYTPFVKKSLKAVAAVYHNPGNWEHTGTGLKNIEKWLGDDIIQINWGLWDLCYRHSDAKVIEIKLMDKLLLIQKITKKTWNQWYKLI